MTEMTKPPLETQISIDFERGHYNFANNANDITDLEFVETVFGAS